MKTDTLWLRRRQTNRQTDALKLTLFLVYVTKPSASSSSPNENDEDYDLIYDRKSVCVMRSVRRRSKAKVNYDFCLISDSICFGKKAKIRRDQETEKQHALKLSPCHAWLNYYINRELSQEYIPN